MKQLFQSSQCFAKGILSSMPVCISYAVIFWAQGVFSCDQGLSFLQAISFTAGIFAAPTQSYILDNRDLPLLALALNTAILNFKFFLMASVIHSLWKVKDRLTIPALYLLTSSTYLIGIIEKTVKNPVVFFIGLAGATYVVAILMTAFGYVMCSKAMHIKDFLMVITYSVVPIHFVCLTVKRKSEKTAIVLSILGLLLTPLVGCMISRSYNIFVWACVAGLAMLCENYFDKPKNLHKATI